MVLGDAYDVYLGVVTNKLAEICNMIFLLIFEHKEKYPFYGHMKNHALFMGNKCICCLVHFDPLFLATKPHAKSNVIVLFNTLCFSYTCVYNSTMTS